MKYKEHVNDCMKLYKGTGYNLLLFMKYNIIPDCGDRSRSFSSARLNYPLDIQLSLFLPSVIASCFLLRQQILLL